MVSARSPGSTPSWLVSSAMSARCRLRHGRGVGARSDLEGDGLANRQCSPALHRQQMRKHQGEPALTMPFEHGLIGQLGKALLVDDAETAEHLCGGGLVAAPFGAVLDQQVGGQQRRGECARAVLLLGYGEADPEGALRRLARSAVLE